MALPKMQTPVYSLTIPSLKKEVKFRPFLVKEEKALLLAQQSEDPNVMVDTLKQVIASCVTTTEPITEELAIFDYEYMFTQIRAKSVGEFAELVFLCDVCEDDKAKVKMSIALNNSQVEFNEAHTKKIPLYDDVGVMMKYPNLDTLVQLDSIKQGDITQLFNVIIKCMDYVYTSDEIMYMKEQTTEEKVEFLDSLTSEQFEKLAQFFTTMPKFRQKIQYDCPVCGKHHDKILEGINYFF